jgi:flagellar hook-basal body complex protein FliE
MNAAALLAQRAYGAASAPMAGTTGAGPEVAASGMNFGAMLANQVTEAVSAGQAAEAQAAQAATGKAEMVDVVTAIAAAEVQMEAMIAFRDQAIQAYQEIMRMPI